MANGFVGEHQAIQLRLVDLPTDALLYIFQFCDPVSLRNVSITCKRLNEIASEDCVWLKRSMVTIITNQLSGEVIRRSFSKLKPKEKCRIGTNWRQGCYTERISNTSTKFMPWLHLEAQTLWISQGRSILALQRLKEGIKMHSPLYTIRLPHKDDITRFVMTDDTIFTGGMDKFICGWSTRLNQLVLCQRSNHSQEIQGLDCKRNILVSGSKDSTIKMWQLGEEASSLQCAQTLQVADRVWCVTLDPSLNSVAVGSAGYHGVHPLHLYDLTRGVEKPMTKSIVQNGAAVFDVSWECPNTLITCGFDTIIRLWDIRIGKCVSAWGDPFGAPGYCLATDQRFSFLCGTAHHGRAQLWDKRAKASIQAYFARSAASSPVYSLRFDPSQLFIAQDSSVNVLDFTKHFRPNSPRADYRSYWTFSK